MYPSRLAIPTLVATLAGCEGDPETAASPLPEPAASELFLAAVDAGNGAPLSDGELTVRYLVRAPITLDATAVERVPFAEPYRIVHAVAADSLVVEVRLEAPSYARIDTVLSVPRGGSAGPFRIAMAPRTERPAGIGRQERPRPDPGPDRPRRARSADRPPQPRTSSRTRTSTGPAYATGTSRSIEETGGPPWPDTGAWPPHAVAGPMRASISSRWCAWGSARSTSVSGPEPTRRSPKPSPWTTASTTGYFYLGQVECALGRFEAGRRTLGQVDNLASTISEAQRPIVLAVADYQRAVCSHDEFQQARTAAEAQQTAARALAELETFIARGEAMTPVPAPVQQAVTDARRRMREITGR